MTEKQLNEYTQKIHRATLTLDTHIDIEVTSVTPDKAGEIGYEKLASFAKMDEGRLDGAFFAAYAIQDDLSDEKYRHALELTLEKIEMIHRAAEKTFTDQVAIAYHPEDVVRIHQDGKKIAIIALENGYPIGEDIGNVRKLYDRGVRYITLCHNGHNQICDSNMNPNGPESIHNGLSPFGEKVVSEMNRLGIIVDISHCSKKTTLDAIALSKAPVIASHSACRGICDESRNIDDEQLFALKRNGGVINIIAINEYIKKTSPERLDAIGKLRESFDLPLDFWKFLCVFPGKSVETRNSYLQELQKLDAKFPLANVEDYVDHIDHVAKLIGVDHVGIGSDYYSGYLSLEGWKDAGEIPHVTQELIKRKYSDENIGKIWSGNLLRVWEEADKIALQRK
ncbi:MAG: dipeptidase [Candidatus Aminicenantes bacterium]|nr:dipeptidase [Candidatus Aminicenantes bacterium]